MYKMFSVDEHYFCFTSLVGIYVSKKSRAWCKTIVATWFYITSYNSSAPSPRNAKLHTACCYDNIIHSTQGREIKHLRTN